MYGNLCPCLVYYNLYSTVISMLCSDSLTDYGGNIAEDFLTPTLKMILAHYKKKQDNYPASSIVFFRILLYQHVVAVLLLVLHLHFYRPRRL